MRMRTLVFAACLLLAAGCSRKGNGNHPFLKKARAFQSEGDAISAEGYYRRMLRHDPACGEAILGYAALCDESLGDPCKAAALYAEYLRLHPAAGNAEEIRTFRQLALEKLRRELNRQKNAGEETRYRQMEEENRKLRRMILTLQNKLKEKKI